MPFKFPLTRRKNFAYHHDRLDPYEDRSTILEQLITREFPLEFLLAAEIAQLRTFAFPNGTKLLHKTGQFEHESLKRLDDTRAILVEMGKDGFDAPHAKTMADHLNAIHGFYDIPNDEFLHTLSTFIFDVQLFTDRFGWRKMTDNERMAIFYIYQQMGELMKIKDIPETPEAFWEWRVNYEAEHMAYHETNHLVAEGLMNGARQMVPRWLGPFLLPFVLSLESKEFAEVLGYKHPPRIVRSFFLSGMWLRKQFNRWFSLWDVLDFRNILLGNFKSYPNGYNPMKLGPHKLVKQIEKQRQNQRENVAIDK